MKKQMLFSQWETLRTLSRMLCFMLTLYLIFLCHLERLAFISYLVELIVINQH